MMDTKAIEKVLTTSSTAYARGIATGLLLAATTQLDSIISQNLELVTDANGHVIGGYLANYIDPPACETNEYGIKEITLAADPAAVIRATHNRMTAAGDATERDFLAGTDIENDMGLAIEICHTDDYTPHARAEFISGIHADLRIITEVSQ